MPLWLWVNSTPIPPVLIFLLLSVYFAILRVLLTWHLNLTLMGMSCPRLSVVSYKIALFLMLIGLLMSRTGRVFPVTVLTSSIVSFLGQPSNRRPFPYPRLRPNTTL